MRVCPCDVCVHGMACRPPLCPLVPAVVQEEQVVQEEEEEEEQEEEDRRVRMMQGKRTTSL